MKDIYGDELKHSHLQKEVEATNRHRHKQTKRPSEKEKEKEEREKEKERGRMRGKWGQARREGQSWNERGGLLMALTRRELVAVTFSKMISSIFT